jgi:hypothetical protein
MIYFGYQDGRAQTPPRGLRAPQLHRKEKRGTISLSSAKYNFYMIAAEKHDM